ncbi:zinc-binding dehydrogenase [Sulfidibacter corallicola]|uniref:zinc-binding dehydrogenase n=1 Tax=Sulfidibacter corallicola TaxID=2818388 RepID=UPI003075C258
MCANAGRYGRTRESDHIVALKPNKGMAYINELYEAGHMAPVIDGPYKLAETPQALRLRGEDKHKGKVVVTTKYHDEREAENLSDGGLRGAVLPRPGFPRSVRSGPAGRNPRQERFAVFIMAP